MLFGRKRKRSKPIVVTGSTVSLQFNDPANPWRDDRGHLFTPVGGANVSNGAMYSSPGTGTYISTPDAPELRLTGDFTLRIGITAWNGSIPHTSVFSKGAPANGTALVGQFFIYDSNKFYATSDKGGSYYDVFNDLPLIKTGGALNLTIVRSGNTLSVYCGTTLVGTANVTGKTFGDNITALNVNGGNLMYTRGFSGRMEYWELSKGVAIFP